MSPTANDISADQTMSLVYTCSDLFVHSDSVPINVFRSIRSKRLNSKRPPATKPYNITCWQRRLFRNKCRICQYM